MDFNKLAQEINQINQEKGFNDSNNSPLETICKIHSEIGEATEQFIKCKPEVWYGKDGKPEGFNVELIDAFIRGLGYLAYREYKINNEAFELSPRGLNALNKLETCAILNMVLSEATHTFRAGYDYLYELEHFARFVYRYFLDNNKIETFEKLLREKIEYNKTRPYRHGNKEA